MNKNYSKSAEIRALKALVETEGYFAQWLGQDLNTMIQNITNDFAIESDTVPYNTAVSLQKQYDDMMAAQSEKRVALCVAILALLENAPYNDGLYDLIVDAIGIGTILQIKLSRGYKLRANENSILSQLLSMPAALEMANSLLETPNY